MSLLPCVSKRLIFSVALMSAVVQVSAQVTALRQFSEYPVSGPLPGDQVVPSISLNQNGGYVVWEENGSAKTGSEIRAAKLSAGFDQLSVFPVNKIFKGDQRNPQVQLLTDGSALFVWQSYGLGNADIYARLMSADGKLAKSDLRVNTTTKAKGSYSKDQQSEPVVAPLNDGGSMVVWQSYGQDGSMFGIYGRKISAAGKLEGNEFLVNQVTAYNQRAPAVTTLTNGNIVVVWVSEFERWGNPADPYTPASIDVYGRIFDSLGNPVSGEKLLNSSSDICANPTVAALPGGGFTVAWSQKDSANRSNSWEIVGRSFDNGGDAAGGDFKINATTYGDQYRPKISAVGSNCVVVWTSLGQDGSREGVYGRVLEGGLQPAGEEFLVNTTTVSQQKFPTIASVNNQFLVIWASFSGATGFDLFGQRYSLTGQP